MPTSSRRGFLAAGLGSAATAAAAAAAAQFAGAGVSIPVERFGFLQQSEGLQIFNATGANRPSYEDPDLKHGVFTHFLISGLDGGAADENGLVTFNQLTNYVIKGVSSFTYEKHRWETQKPYITSDDVSGDFLLGGKLTAAPPPVQTAVAGPQPIDVLQDAFERAEKAPNRLEMLRAFLTLFPVNRLAPLAEFDVAEADPSPAAAYFNLGVKYLDQGEHPLAIEAFDKVLRLDPWNGVAAGYYSLELCYDLALGEAIREAGNALRKQPGNIPALLGRGIAYTQVGETAKGRADLLQVVSSPPNDARGYEFRGDAHLYLGEHDLAIADFTKAISLRPGYGVPYNDRANAYADRKDYVRALSDYSEALRLLPLNAVIWANRGMANAIAGHLDVAFADLAEALRLRPNFSMAYMFRGQVNYEHGHFEEAVRDFSSTLRQTGFSYAIRALEMRGMAYLSWKKYSEAANDFTEALRADPNNTYLLVQRASAREALNDHAGADRAAAARLKKQ